MDEMFVSPNIHIWELYAPTWWHLEAGSLGASAL